MATASPSLTGTARPTYSGWLTFAGILACMIGVFNIATGFIAIVDDEYYVVGDNQLLIFDLTGWGWFWLIFGAIQLVVGIGILGGNMWARIAGGVLAFLAAFFHMLWLPAFPVWSTIVIALSMLVIYGLVVPSKNATG